MDIKRNNITYYKYRKDSKFWDSNISIVVNEEELTIFIIGEFVSGYSLGLLKNKISVLTQMFSKTSIKKIHLNFSLTNTCGTSELLVYKLCKIINNLKTKGVICHIRWCFSNQYTEQLEFAHILNELCDSNLKIVEEENLLNTFYKISEFAELY